MELRNWQSMELVGEDVFGAYVSEICVEHLEKRLVTVLKNTRDEFGYNVILDGNTLSWAEDDFPPLVTIKRDGHCITVKCSGDANQFGLPLLLAAAALIPVGGANPAIIIDGKRVD